MGIRAKSTRRLKAAFPSPVPPNRTRVGGGCDDDDGDCDDDDGDSRCASLFRGLRACLAGPNRSKDSALDGGVPARPAPAPAASRRLRYARDVLPRPRFSPVGAKEEPTTTREGGATAAAYRRKECSLPRERRRENGERQTGADRECPSYRCEPVVGGGRGEHRCLRGRLAPPRSRARRQRPRPVGIRGRGKTPSMVLAGLAALLLPAGMGAASSSVSEALGGSGVGHRPGWWKADGLFSPSGDGGGERVRPTPQRSLSRSEKGSKGSSKGGKGGKEEPKAVEALVIGGNFTLNGKSTNVAQYNPVR